jgi:serine-type D-Ala-D-Ala carboxypeptidase/endopeptidase (penicillin-binding protein 4)
MRFYITLFSIITITLQFSLAGHAQYIPTYYKKANVAVAKPIDSLALFPGRKKLIQCIENMDTDDLLKNSTWGVMVSEASTGNTIASHNEHLLLTPASLMKSITTGVGYLQLGANFRFVTKLEYSGNIGSDSVLHGKLIIVAGGDPTICCYRWAETHPEVVFGFFASKLKSMGINKIDGPIVLDKSIFDDQQVSPGWFWGDMGNYFGAGASALAYNENIVHFWLRSGDSIGAPTIIDSIYPKLPNMEFRNYVISAASNTGDNANVYSAPNGTVIELRGTIPAGKSSFLLKGSNFIPESTFGNALNEFLDSNGIATTSKFEIIDHRTPPDTSLQKILIASYYSPTYNTIASFTNKVSHNMFAEAILKQLGYRRFGIGSYYSGVRAIDIALAKYGITQSEMINVDGSGLSKNDLITPAFICKFLRMMYKTDAYKKFYSSLPEAGESGTIGGMFKGTAAAHNLRAKSGSIERVRSYGGYVTNRKGKLLTFAIIVNNFNERQNLIKGQLEKLMIAIAESD